MGAMPLSAFRSRLAVLVLTLTPLAAVPACSSSSDCTDVGCTSGVHFRSALRFQGAADSLDITVCRNGVCAHGTAKSSGCSLSGSIDVTCAISVSAGTTAIAFDVAAASPDDIKDGDIYVFRATRGATNETLIEVTKAAKYATQKPNGPTCPPTCKSVDLS